MFPVGVFADCNSLRPVTFHRSSVDVVANQTQQVSLQEVYGIFSVSEALDDRLPNTDACNGTRLSSEPRAGDGSVPGVAASRISTTADDGSRRGNASQEQTALRAMSRPPVSGQQTCAWTDHRPLQITLQVLQYHHLSGQMHAKRIRESSEVLG